MSDYSSRLHIIVRDESKWSLLEEMNLSPYSLYAKAKEIFDSDDTECIIEDGWSVYENDLEDFVRELANKLGTDCVIIADTSDCSVEPNEFVACYFGEEVITKYMGEDGDKYSDMFFNTDIYETEDWIKQAIEYGLDISNSEIEYLGEFGIIVE